MPGKSQSSLPSAGHIGRVYYTEYEPGRWILRYRDPQTHKDVRRRLVGTYNDAETAAAHCHTMILRRGGFIPGKDRPENGPTLRTAFDEALERPGVSDAVTRERKRIAGRFIAWLTDTYPKVKLWSDMKPFHLQAYIDTFTARKRAYDTIRLAIAPVRLAWRWAYDNYPHTVGPWPSSFRIPNKSERDDIDCLGSSDVAIVLAWFADHAPRLHGIVTLQALAGLRMLEAVYLRHKDVNVKAKTIHITKTPWHQPKTSLSDRTIPLCDDAWEVVKKAFDASKGELLFTNRLETPWTKDAISRRLCKAFSNMAATPDVIMRAHGKRLTLNPQGVGCPRLAAQPPRRLRASFITMVDSLGVGERLWKRYVGHTADDIAGRHYRRITVEELRAVSTAMNGWKCVK